MKLTKLMKAALLAAYHNDMSRSFKSRTIYALARHRLVVFAAGRYRLTTTGRLLAWQYAKADHANSGTIPERTKDA